MGKTGGRELRKDYTELLQELLAQQAENAPSDDEATEAESIVVFSPEDLAIRQRMNSNQNIRYATYNGLIHDKTCERLKKIPATSLEYFPTYPKKGCQCSDCAIKAYLRAGAEDMGCYRRYSDFFEKVGLKADAIRSLYLTHQVKTRMDANVLTVKCRADTWKISPSNTCGIVTLLHNNYTPLSDGTRAFYEGYHIQKENIPIAFAIKLLTSYQYRPHHDYAQNSAAVAVKPDKVVTRIGVENISTPPVQPMNESLYIPSEIIRTSAFHRLWVRIKNRLLRNHKMVFAIELTKSKAAPGHNAICAYVWEDEKGYRHLMIGQYSDRRQTFHSNFGGSAAAISLFDVIAWQELDLSYYQN